MARLTTTPSMGEKMRVYSRLVCDDLSPATFCDDVGLGGGEVGDGAVVGALRGLEVCWRADALGHELLRAVEALLGR